MKFFKFPYLVQRKIIPQLPPSAFFLFSTCSKKTLRLVYSMNKRLKSEIWFETRLGRRAYEFYIQEENEIKEPIVNIVTENMIAINRKWLKINLNGEEVRIHCDGTTKFQQTGSYFTKDDQFTNVLNIFKYLLKLFNTSSHVYINPYFSYIHGCKSEDLDLSRLLLRRLISYYPSENMAILPEYYHITDEIEEGNRILDIDQVIMQDMYRGIIKRLYDFKGKHLLCTNARINSYLLSIFLENWKKQKYPNLSSLIIHSAPRYSIEEQLFLKESLKKSDKKRVFTYPQIIRKHYKFPDYIKFDSTNGYDLRRDGDGKLATIKVTNDYFMFFVWD